MEKDPEGVFSFYDGAKYLRYDESLDENKVGNSYDNYASYASATNDKKVAYLYKETTTTAGVNYVTYADFSTVETTVNAEIDDDTAIDEEEEESVETATNVWLLASSIIIAATLVLAVVSLIVRKLFAKSRKFRSTKPQKSANPKKEKKAKTDKK